MKVEVVNFKTTKDYEYNLQKALKILNNSIADFTLLPEVCLTGFDYENFNKANDFSKTIINELSKLKKAFGVTIIENNKNYFYLFDEGVVYKRAKYHLFSNENRFFRVGSKPEIFEWNGLRVASLICFELRFIEYWVDFFGVDLIIVPARWGKERIEHFKTLLKALSLSTQSYVIACNSANEKSFGAILDGWGEGVEISGENGVYDINFEKNFKIRRKLKLR